MYVLVGSELVQSWYKKNYNDMRRKRRNMYSERLSVLNNLYMYFFYPVIYDQDQQVIEIQYSKRFGREFNLLALLLDHKLLRRKMNRKPL